MVKLFGDGEVVRSVDVEPTVVEPVAANDAPLVVVEPVVVAPSSVERTTAGQTWSSLHTQARSTPTKS